MPEDGQSSPAGTGPERAAGRTPATGEEVTQSLRGAFSGMFSRDMERNEKLLALTGALVAVVTGFVLLGAVLAEHHHTKGQLPAAAYLGISGGFGVLLFLAARHGSRVASSVVAMLGGMVAMPGLLRYPYLALAVWLLLRNSRAMREQRGPTARQPARKPERARRGTQAPAAETASRRPDPSKRYTPPGSRRRR